MMFSEYLLAKARKMFYRVNPKKKVCFIWETRGDYNIDNWHCVTGNDALLWFIRRHEPNQTHRDCFGRLTFNLGDYEVEHVSCAPYRIVKKYPYYRTNAVFDTPFCEEVPKFDSWIQAVRFLKEHEGELL